MPNVSFHLDPAALENVGSRAEVRQACLDIAKDIAGRYRQVATGEIGESVVARYDPAGGAQVAVTSPLAHLFEFGAPGHLLYGGRVAPLAARGWLRQAAEASGHQLSSRKR